MQNPYIFLVLLAANMIYLKLGKLLKTSNNFLWQNNILSIMMVLTEHTQLLPFWMNADFYYQFILPYFVNDFTFQLYLMVNKAVKPYKRKFRN